MVLANGIDVSQYQGMIDWEVAKNRIDFAIIRCGYGQDLPNQDDRYYKRNADECTRLNIPFGVYLYSYAMNEQDALSEARHVLRLIKDYKMDYPIYIDLEDPRTVATLSNEQLLRNVRVFVEELANNGYLPGVYASLFWWKTKLTDPFYENYTKWIANYADVLNYDGTYDMWQYTQTGFVEGINSYVDLDRSYRDFPTYIRENGLNNYGKTIPTTPTTQYKVGDQVTFSHVFISSESDIPLIPYRNTGTITRIVSNARNPYLIGDGLGWVNNQVIQSTPSSNNISLVDAMIAKGLDPSFENRRRIASLNGINNYMGTAQQNLTLLNLLQNNTLNM